MKKLPRVVAILLASLTAPFALIPTAGDAQEAIVINTIPEMPQPLFADDEPQIRLEVINPPDNWDRFVAEFDDDHKPSGLVLDSIAEVKYSVDATLFGVAELASRLSHLLEIRYSHGHFNFAREVKIKPSQLTHNGPFSLEDTRIKFDLALNEGKPYAGLRVVIPFGN